ncbi:hypothetical protein KDL01_14195 [Actinospica durhamensis]|uniref:Uncharacterized protein n=1 Tax=Actinospica durhamensis TaxID=1508375 RepID=A0A941ENC4_9ACTN|nr:hypothetical protein [Actinospica durhamensis]MBR7834421.1 hypothetical protein [Actinospica durhamensis]
MTTSLFVVCVLLTLVLFRIPDLRIAVPVGVSASYTATDAVARLFGRSAPGGIVKILRSIRSLLSAAQTVGALGN